MFGPTDFFALLKPDLSYNSIAVINFEGFSKLGYGFYIIDVDNTLTPRNSLEISPEILGIIVDAVKEGHIKDFCFVSNIGIRSKKSQARVAKIAKKFGTDKFVCAFWPNIKPKAKPFLKALDLMPGATIKNTVVIGDQMFSDILGGNRLGLLTILVKPLGKDHPITFWKRWLEKIVANF